jgi:hypothetical protein
VEPIPYSVAAATANEYGLFLTMQFDAWGAIQETQFHKKLVKKNL